MNVSRDKIILKHMREDVQDILSFIDGSTYSDFSQSHLLLKAVSMSLLNIGELARELSDGVKEPYSAIPWRSIIGLRNRTAHGYHSLDPRILWEIASVDIPPLLQVIDNALEEFSEI
jgi:uncharacterized protein with HEPN domain